jgi:hypothetical protein
MNRIDKQLADPALRLALEAHGAGRELKVVR